MMPVDGWAGMQRMAILHHTFVVRFTLVTVAARVGKCWWITLWMVLYDRRWQLLYWNKLWYPLYCILGNCVGSVGRCCVTFTVLCWGYCTGISLCKLAVFHLLSFLINNRRRASLVDAGVASVSGFLHLAWYVLPGLICHARCTVFAPSRL